MSALTDQDALRWLRSFVDTEKALPRTPTEFNLPRTQALLDLLGSPQRRYPSVVIAGTKGKGSTAAIVESILRAGGLRTGLYTSPHLHTFRERIQVDRELITPGMITQRITEIQPLVAQMAAGVGGLSIYEVETALALAHFAAAQVGCAVLEVGLGGRDDAVNAVTPTVSAISSLSLDHMQILGATLGEIAAHKAGIIKPGVPIVSVPQAAEAAAVLAHVAAAQGAPLYIAGPDGLRHAADVVRPYPTVPRPDTLRLAGQFQIENAQLASGIALLLRDAGVPIPDKAFAEGLASVRWPGRLETLRLRPRLIVDGAHNGDSARKLMAALREIHPSGRLFLILGASADKDLAAIAAALVPHAETLIVTQSPHLRAATIPALLAAVRPFARNEPLATLDASAAIAEALRRARPDDLICATGSLFVVAAVREACGYLEADGG
ncbi:bifunctional folylpolyglutamate synthase/dihydrofolate synthase [Chloroflexales bacterium ZM16-3]|nr:bifunctional folylpolyglutamate synthase/dihydrofolate synthase [Chloroflexales bacterium ZM16-3]